MTDPVHQKPDGTWWFWDETWAEEIGPFAIEASARGVLDNYLRELERCNDQPS